jgi:outer membrane protein, protease secretion system
VALQDARAERAATVAAVRLAERDLARLMGTGEGTVADAGLAEVSVPDLPAPSAPDANPSVAEARFRFERAQARMAAERADRFPRLDASAALLDYGTLDSEHVLEWRAGVSVAWPLFTGGVRSAAIRRAAAELAAAEQAVGAARLDADARADAARAAIEAADARAEALDASVTQWTDLVAAEALALEAGAGVQRDLLDAEAGLFRARAGLVGARAEAVLARLRLAGALGVLDTAWIAGLSGGTQ